MFHSVLIILTNQNPKLQCFYSWILSYKDRYTLLQPCQCSTKYYQLYMDTISIIHQVARCFRVAKFTDWTLYLILLVLLSHGRYNDECWQILFNYVNSESKSLVPNSSIRYTHNWGSVTSKRLFTSDYIPCLCIQLKYGNQLSDNPPHNHTLYTVYTVSNKKYVHWAQVDLYISTKPIRLFARYLIVNTNVCKCNVKE